MTEHQFRFYDFEKNWDEFYKVWTSDEVQDVLEPDMQAWCEHEAYFEHTEDGMKKPTWKRCDDLWRYSKTDFHAQRNLDKCNEYVQTSGCVEKYEQAMSRSGIKFSDKVQAYEAFWNVAGDELYKMFQPKPGSLEANILFSGANYLAGAMEVAAQKMFPDGFNILLEHENDMVIANDNLIFDFVRFYFQDESTVSDLVRDFMLVELFSDTDDEDMPSSENSSDDCSKAVSDLENMIV